MRLATAALYALLLLSGCAMDGCWDSFVENVDDGFEEGWEDAS